MTGLAKDVLVRLGEGQAIDAVCKAAGLTRAQFDTAWAEELRRRVPRLDGRRTAPLGKRAFSRL